MCREALSITGVIYIVKVTIQLGDDTRETLATLSRAYQGLEHLSDQSSSQSSDVADVLDVLNCCLTGTIEALAQPTNLE